MRHSSTWKHAEREIARRLGMERNGATGQATPDAENNWLAVEVKHGKQVPKFPFSAMAQAQRNAGDKLAVVVLHPEGAPYDASLVCIRLADFVAWFGEARDA